MELQFAKVLATFGSKAFPCATAWERYYGKEILEIVLLTSITCHYGPVRLALAPRGPSPQKYQRVIVC